jgi:hypothetical protein
MAAFGPTVLLGLKVTVLAIVADTLITWVLAFSKGEFDIRLAPQFLRTNIFPYMAVLLVTAFLTLWNPEVYKPVFFFFTVIIAGKFSVEALKDKLIQFFKPANEPPSLG